MIRTFTLVFIICPIIGFSQFGGLNLSYSYYKGIQDDLFDGHGFKIGSAYENIMLGASDFFMSIYASGGIYFPQSTVLQEDIEFEFPDNQTEYGNANLHKSNIGLSLGTDLGYWVDDFHVLQPYLTLGITLRSKKAELDYELYNAVDCECLSDGKHTLSNTLGLGFVTGGGVKIMAIPEWLVFDIRLAVSGAWVTGKQSTPLPDIETFHIDAYGDYQVNYYDKKFFWSFMPTVGVTFNLPISSMFSNDNEEDDDWETDSYSEDEEDG